MYSNILIPVSLEEDRDVTPAIRAARALASKGARVTFLHVVEIPPAYAMEYLPQETFPQRKEAAKAELEPLTEQIDNAATVVLEGPAGRTLVDWAEDNGADCIVITSHPPAISDIFLGSTAAWVVRHANAAIHVIR